MQFAQPMIPATLLRRYKRFLADVELASGEVITVHTPNTGSMLGLLGPGTKVWLRDTQDPKRKYRYSWEIASTPSGQLVGINTLLANQIVAEAISKGWIKELSGYDSLKKEVKYGEQNSRIDILLAAPGKPDCYIEVKNVTAQSEVPGETKVAIFPDAVSSRGLKHLHELIYMTQQGYRAVMFYLLQRDDLDSFRAASEIDPEYARALKQAYAAGVEILAYVTSFTGKQTPTGIVISKPARILPG